MDLQEIRQKISVIDQQIIDLISERIALVPNIVQCKKEHQLTVFHPEREKQLCSSYWRLAVEKRINPELIQEIFFLIFSEMRKLQEEKFQGLSSPVGEVVNNGKTGSRGKINEYERSHSRYAYQDQEWHNGFLRNG